MRLLLCLFLLIQNPLFSQDHFYYLSDGTKVSLPVIENLHLVHFKNGLGEQGFILEGFQFAGNYYVVFDTTEIDEYYSDYVISKSYNRRGDTLYESDEILLQFKASTSQSQKNNLIELYNLELLHTSPAYERYACSNPTITAQSIFESNLVKYCHPNLFFRPKATYIPNDIYFNKQFYIHNTGQQINDGNSGTADADMDVVEAWDITKGDSNIVIAVMDRGITSNHIDLPNTRQVRLAGGNLGASVSGSNPNDLTPEANFYHGDPCAGVIAATQDNAIGISGIAPLSKIMPVKFELGASFAIIADCITFADTNGAQILSGSFIGPDTIVSAIETAILNAQNNNMLMFFAAGNTRYDLLASGSYPNYNPSIGYVGTPANSNYSSVVTVGAGDRNDQLAIYSPINEKIDVVAPSSSTVWDALYSFTNTEGSDVWSIDIPNTAGANTFKYGDSFIQQNEMLPSTGLNHLDFTGRFGGTSAATPMVAGVAALVMSVNNCISNLQVKDILLNTADKVGGYDYNWSSTKPGHSKQFGYGRVNAHKAVLAAQAMQSSSLDLMIKDVPNDFGAEPDTIAQYLYLSEDIWLRNQPDGLINQYHENPEYDPVVPVYVYIRVKNKSCSDATISDSLTLYWAKASTALSWPNHWNGSITSPALMGDSVSTLSIGNLKAGTDTIFEIPWLIPNPTLYNGINPDPWHFCLLARIKSQTDTMTVAETSTLWLNVKNNNNIAWKNVTVVNMHMIGQTPTQVEHGLGAVIGIGNDIGSEKSIKLVFKPPTQFFGSSITTDAEVTIKLDSTSLQKFQNGGETFTGMDYMGEGVFKVTADYATIEGLTYDEWETSTLYVGFNFLTEEVEDKVVYKYYVEEYDTENNFIGGEEYFIHRDERPLFLAEAGANQNLIQGQSAILQAQDIGEPALYRWYDENGILFYEGKDTSFVPSGNQNFLLEIIALRDGFKDYDSKEIHIRDNYISSLSPNPILNSQNLYVTCVLLNSVSAQLVLSNTLGTINRIYNVSATNPTAMIPVHNLTPDNYTLRLIVNGNIIDTRPVVIN